MQKIEIWIDNSSPFVLHRDPKTHGEYYHIHEEKESDTMYANEC